MEKKAEVYLSVINSYCDARVSLDSGIVWNVTGESKDDVLRRVAVYLRSSGIDPNTVEVYETAVPRTVGMGKAKTTGKNLGGRPKTNFPFVYWEGSLDSHGLPYEYVRLQIASLPPKRTGKYLLIDVGYGFVRVLKFKNDAIATLFRENTSKAVKYSLSFRESNIPIVKFHKRIVGKVSCGSAEVLRAIAGKKISWEERAGEEGNRDSSG